MVVLLSETAKCRFHHPQPCRSYRSGLQPVMPAAIHMNTNALHAGEVEWIAATGCQKLALDFVQRVGLLGVMDEDTLELIIRLGTRVGMIMEEASRLRL